MNEKLSHYFNEILLDILLYAPRILSALLVFAGGLWLINYSTRVFEKTMKRKGFDVSLQPFLSSLASGSLKIILLISVAGMLGIQTTSFVAVIGAAGLAVGLALQGSLSNFAGGVLTLVFKPYKVGDLIEAQGQFGEVKEIQIFNTILLTTDKRTIILPNGAVSNGTVVNYSKQGNIRLDIAIHLAPETNIDEARKVFLALCNESTLVLKEPQASLAVVKILGGIHVSLRPYVDPKNYWEAQAHINEQINNAMIRSGIREPIPEYTIFQR